MTDGLIKVRPKNDLTGKTFGKLTVLRQGPDHISNSGKRFMCWWCKCSCGNPDEVLAKASLLLNGHVQSCGCITKERLKKYNKYDLTGSYGIGWTNKDEEFYFDIKDFGLIKNFCWYYDDHGYLVAKSGKKHIRISRYLMGVLDEDRTKIYVDHKNGDTRDNRRENLRIVTPSQNAMNSKLMSNNTSGCSGVYKYGDKWLAMIYANNEKIFLGYYDTYEDAVKIRKEAEEKYFGEYSYDNSRGIKKGDG